MIRRNTTQTTQNAANFTILLLYHWHRFAIFCNKILWTTNRRTKRRSMCTLSFSFTFDRFIFVHVPSPFIPMCCYYYRYSYMIWSDKRLKMGQFTRLAIAKSNNFANRVLTTCSAGAPMNRYRGVTRNSTETERQCAFQWAQRHACDSATRREMPKININESIEYVIVDKHKLHSQENGHRPCAERDRRVVALSSEPTSKRCVYNGQKDKHATPLPKINKTKQKRRRRNDWRRWKRSLSKQQVHTSHERSTHFRRRRYKNGCTSASNERYLLPCMPCTVTRPHIQFEWMDDRARTHLHAHKHSDSRSRAKAAG